jgi:hypothetical protein
MLQKKAKCGARNLTCRDTLLPSVTVCYRGSTYIRMGGGEKHDREKDLRLALAHHSPWLDSCSLGAKQTRRIAV